MRSSRLGERGFKPLLPFASSTIVESSARPALEAGCRLLLVLGCRGDEVAALFEAEPYRGLAQEGRLLLVDNPRWESGMVSSIQAALTSVRGEAFFVAHADMPLVTADAYRLLAATREAEGSGGAASAYAASHRGEAGHPVLMSSAWVPEILALEGGERLRPFLAGKGLRLVEAGEGALRDIDTPGDYESAIL
jgi:nicotine blue oxidoreductase